MKSRKDGGCFRMNIVFTMAGQYSRFMLFGAKVPKYLLPLGQGTIISNIISDFIVSAPNAKLYFIANRKDQLFYPILKSILKSNGVATDSLIYIDDTSSQLETALFANEVLSANSQSEPICFTNIDTIIRGRQKFFDRMQSAESVAGWIDGFVGNSNQYSYVRTDGSERIVEVVDKNIISEIACSGLYGFRDFTEMQEISKTLLGKNTNANFTDLYNEMLVSGMEVRHLMASDPSDTIVLGTPEEYIVNIHRFV